MEPWPYAAESEELKVGWRRLTRKVFSGPDGKEHEYYTKESVGDRCIATIALTSNNTVIVAEQFRPGPEKILEELPGGGCEKDEDVEAAAARELHEETGYSAGSMKYLGAVYKDAYSNTTSHYFLARDCVKDAEQHLDDGEFVNVKEITITKLFENARNLMMTDTEAVLLAYEELKSIEEGINE